jgi:predicted KAP-like P-loop ATPase
MSTNPTTNQLIDVNLNLPNYTDNLKEAESMLNAIRKDIIDVYLEDKLSDEIHEKLFDKIVIVLDWVGRMSMPAFNVHDQLEEMYMTIHCKAPKLGRMLFDKHYHNIHRPYSSIKNRCFNTIDELDVLYKEKFNKNPPNWIN